MNESPSRSGTPSGTGRKTTEPSGPRPAAGNGNGSEPELGPLGAVMPHSVEVEQQLIGALLNNNDLHDRVADLVEARHFFDPAHAKLWEAISATIQKGQLASAITLRTQFADAEFLKDLGGPDYLVRLAGAAISSYAVRDYARLLRDHAIRRELMQLCQEVSDRAANVGHEEDADALIVANEERLYQIAVTGQSESGSQSFLGALTAALKVAAAAHASDGSIAGLPTGLAELDRKLGGLHDSDLLIIAGRPAMGKTALAANIAFNVARAYRPPDPSDSSTPGGPNGSGNADQVPQLPRKGGVVGFFSLEMGAPQIVDRMLAAEAGIPANKIRQGSMTDEEYRRYQAAAMALEDLPLHFDDKGGMTVAEIAARARRMKRTRGLDLLVVDYIQLCRGTGHYNSRVNEITEITTGLKTIAKDLRIPVIALSQLSRQVESRDDKRPLLSDLRESGSIEQDADAVLFVYRPEYYLEREEPREEEDPDAHAKWADDMSRVSGQAEVIIGKQRHGPIGTAKLAFDLQTMKFSDLAYSWEAGRS